MGAAMKSLNALESAPRRQAESGTGEGCALGNPPSAANDAFPAVAPSLLPRFAPLGAYFHSPVSGSPVAAASMVHFNAELAEELGFTPEPQLPDALLGVLSGNRPWPGYASLASVYGGHQFGTWVPQLGDGRALLIAELETPGGQRREIQLKGSGPTPYSRGLDGRAVLRSSIREYLCSEAMHQLGVPTTRCLSLVGSSEPVQREAVETAAVVCRVSPSFVRFGHFEYFFYRKEPEQVRILADHVIGEQFPHLAELPDRYILWLTEVVERTARLMAQWQSLGFCHGVMNTDNFSVLGLTIDYGPFGFLDRFRQHHVCNHSDYEGRYAYSAQPQVGQWNCSRLLRACLSLLAENTEKALEVGTLIFERYAPVYAEAMMRRWADKLGLAEVREGDTELVNGLLSILQRGKNDFTRSFRHLSRLEAESAAPAVGIREEITDLDAFDAWVGDYRARLVSEGNTDDGARAERMNRINPKYVLRNHLAQQAIEQAESGSYGELERLMMLLKNPFDEQPAMEAYAAEPQDGQRAIEVSCSS
jgi:serine/tyrosine/threonine adenylyltransferase